MACLLSAALAIIALVNVRRAEYLDAKKLKLIKVIAYVCLLLGIIGTATGVHETTGSGISWGAASFLAILSLLLTLAGDIAITLVK